MSTIPPRRRRRRSNLPQIILAVLAVGVIVYLLPPVKERVDWRLNTWRMQIMSVIRPPEREVFVPQKENTPAPTPEITIQPTQTPTLTVEPTAVVEATAVFTPTVTVTPLPDRVALTGVRYMDQHGVRNYCAPSTLGMALSYWGWKGTRTDVGKAIKPYEDDYNVMPYEMEEYAINNAGLLSVTRIGGTIELIKSLVAGGFPVLTEMGVYQLDLANNVSWMGHYVLVTGYDDSTGEFITQDAYKSANRRVKYTEFEKEWRSFNFLYMVVHSAEREPELRAIMGPMWDETAANRAAYERANREIAEMTDIYQYFAWYNRGTSMVKLQDYAGAAQSYDEAFAIYETLPEDTRPFRMVWYQTGPYMAYYYAGRYQDVVNLADFTLGLTNHLGLEESNYWRAMGNAAIGNREAAIDDLRTTLKIHPDFEPSLLKLQEMGAN